MPPLVTNNASRYFAGVSFFGEGIGRGAHDPLVHSASSVQLIFRKMIEFKLNSTWKEASIDVYSVVVNDFMCRQLTKQAHK